MFPVTLTAMGARTSKQKSPEFRGGCGDCELPSRLFLVHFLPLTQTRTDLLGLESDEETVSSFFAGLLAVTKVPLIAHITPVCATV